MFSQVAASHRWQLAATAVVSGAVVAAAMLGYQQQQQAARLRRLKRSIEGEVETHGTAVSLSNARSGIGRGNSSYDEDEDENEDEDEGEDEDRVEAASDAEERRALALARRAQAGDYAEDVILEQLTRNRAFLTPTGLERVRGAAVVVVGCGGVGSHCAAALARSGVARIRLVDFDQVSLSSLNRHAVATLADVGRPKVVVLARRLLAVAPWVRFDLRRDKFDAAAAERLLEPWRDDIVDGASGNVAGAGAGSGRETASGAESSGESGGVKDLYGNSSSGNSSSSPIHFVVDAIDNIDTKVELLRYCHEHGVPVIASMGAGTKSDPTKVVVGDIGSSAEDRLSRATRRRLKLLGITAGIPAVYSTEAAGDGKAVLLPLPDHQFAQGKEAVRELGALPDFRVRILPVLGTMPAVFGYTLANHILLSLSGYPHEYSAVKGRDKLYEQILGAVHGFEEKLIRLREEDEKTEAGAADAATDKPSSKPSKKEAAATTAALGLRIPLTPGDVAFLVEEIYRGRSAVSGLPTRTMLVRWQLPADDNGSSTSTLRRLGDSDGPAAQPSQQNNNSNNNNNNSRYDQRWVPLRLSDLVCMTREEAARHQDAVLLPGRGAKGHRRLSDLYDAETLARIEARRQETRKYEKLRC